MSSLFGIGANGAASFYNGVATQSLRFAYTTAETWLARTPNAGNRKTHTLSVWVKRSGLGASQGILEARGSGDTGNVDIWFDNNDRIEVSGSSTYWRTTTRKFRDISSWYHIVVVTDTTDSTAADRLKIYVNGTRETSFSDNNHYSQNTDYAIGGNVEHRIGDGYGHFNGYMARYEFVDGIALTPDSFGETKNGVWIPKAYTGSYGTNGHKLEFKETGTNADANGLGADTSGNDNHYTPTAITGTDSALPDSPENNFCTLNPLDNDNITLTEGNLSGISTANAHNACGTTFGVTGGKWYWEIRSGGTGSNYFFGMARSTFSMISQYTNDAHNFADLWCVATDGPKANGGGEVSYGSALSSGDILQLAFDLDNGKFYAGKNGTYFASGDPAAGTNAAFTNVPTDEDMSAFYGNSTGPLAHIFNFGQDSSFAGTKTAQGNTDANGKGDFYYAPPSGFLALCTANLPETTISPNADTQADDNFNTVIYSGNSSNGHGITGVGFQPDWTWIKARSDTRTHVLYDSTRGAGKYLSSDNSNAEGTDTTSFASFNSDGFTVGTTENYINNSSHTYVAWNWKANGGTTTTNDASSTGVGSIDSVYQANTTAGFSIVTYTGTGSAGTIAHGLGKAPNMSIIKPRNFADNWIVTYDMVDGSDDQAYLNLTNAGGSPSASYAVAQNATTLGLTDWNNVNDASDTYVAYCFHSVEGYSKFGSYSGNGNADGAFVHLGFRPAWVMVKRTDSTNNWVINDTTRATFNEITGGSSTLYADTTNQESDLSTNVDFLSNGFKARTTGGHRNASGTYIYMAFAEAPFKYANAR